MNKYYLMRIKTKGLKNLEKDIILDFCDLTFKPGMDFEKSKVKSIYGYNGSGKSAIINSVALYHSLVFGPNYLLRQETINKLNNIINKKINSFEFEATFAIKNDEQISFIRHYLKIIKSVNGYEFAEESISYPVGKSLNDKFSNILEIKDNQYTGINNISKLLKQMDPAYKRFPLAYNSIISVFLECLATDVLDIKSFNKENKNFAIIFLNLIKAINKIHFYCFDKETNNLDRFLENAHVLKMAYLKTSKHLEKEIGMGANFRYLRIPKSCLKMYQDEVPSLYEFIHIFKPELKDIILIHQEDKESYDCDLKFVYSDYKISLKYESIGLRHLVDLYAYLKAFVKGDIVFIDEIDSNISGVILSKMIKYFNEEAKGQLCFTSHNFEPMEVLKKRAHGIDFISEKHEIVSWVINGNYNPVKQYKEGMTKDSPYNVDSFDFIKAFGYKE